jgi:hypothetical protein
MTRSLYMVVERFRNGDAVPCYRRFRDEGRMLPPGLDYVASWVDRALLDEWMEGWADLAEFEVIPVRASKDAEALIAPRL